MRMSARGGSTESPTEVFMAVLKLDEGAALARVDRARSGGVGFVRHDRSGRVERSARRDLRRRADGERCARAFRRRQLVAGPAIVPRASARRPNEFLHSSLLGFPAALPL